MADPRYSQVGDVPTRTIEECSELIQALCKVRRFGMFNYNPDTPGTTNMQQVLYEVEDVRRVLKELDNWLDEKSSELDGEADG
jgi:hypothetical protein